MIPVGGLISAAYLCRIGEAVLDSLHAVSLLVIIPPWV